MERSKCMNVPKIRFKEFKENWDNPIIDSIFELRNGYTPSKSIKEYWENGTIPWYRMEDIRAKGNILSEAFQYITPLAIKGSGLFKPYSIILATTATIGVHAMVIADSLANQRFTNFSIRKSLFNKYMPEFVNYAFYKIDRWSEKNTNSGGLLSVDVKSLLKEPFYTPYYKEQQKIASYFQSLDSLIQSTSKKLASLKQIKAASLQSMFPQEGETVPKIRFKEFEGEWEKEKLGKLFKERIENNINGELLSVTINNGIIKASNNGRFDNSNNDKSHYKAVKIEDIVYNTMRMWQGASGYSAYEGIVSPAYTVIIPQEQVFPLFFAYLFKTQSLINIFRIHSQGLTTDTWNLKFARFSIIEVCFPKSKLEQQKIASYFCNLDKQISLQTQRLEKLKQIKAACLDKMFV